MILLLLIWLFFYSVHKKVLCVAYLTDVNRSGQDVWRHVTYKWYPIRLWDKVKFHSCIKTILHFGEKSSQWRYLKYYYMYCNKCLFFKIWFSAIHFQLLVFCLFVCLFVFFLGGGGGGGRDKKGMRTYHELFHWHSNRHMKHLDLNSILPEREFLQWNKIITSGIIPFL